MVLFVASFLQSLRQTKRDTSLCSNLFTQEPNQLSNQFPFAFLPSRYGNMSQELLGQAVAQEQMAGSLYLLHSGAAGASVTFQCRL